MAFFWPVATALAFVFWIAAWAIVAGLLRIIAAIRLRHEVEGEWAPGLSGALLVVWGGLLAFMPGGGDPWPDMAVWRVHAGHRGRADRAGLPGPQAAGLRRFRWRRSRSKPVHVPRGLARRVGSASVGSSGQGWRG
ncbi:DUF308 domain-containing protein [Paracoccus sp. DMF-8]|uniref:HdeD family acid-resistance protein n=1 Tax=Paracoccus sp. DMF-8 TaxID=3019445 RepID=UPI0023E3846C|nr:DUF308 domain-containing protein [Paracoccus sp. DMF-8]MDF3607226.1 DUF308 domain-containing protein [Paracoccus sp. DMF-8]